MSSSVSDSMTGQIKLGTIIQQIRGVSYKPSDIKMAGDPDGIGLIRANNIQDDELNFEELVWVDKKNVASEQMLRKGDIVVCSSSGSKNLVGKAAIANENLPYAFGAFCKVVRVSAMNVEFVGHFFQSPRYRRTISAASAGANINNIRNEHIDEMLIPVYSEEKQQQIVDRVSHINRLIACRKNQIELLEELVKSRFVELFGDPKVNPFGWNTTIVGDVIASCEAGWSGNGTQRERKDGEIAVLKVSAVTKGYFIPGESKVLDDQDNIKKYVYPQAGDLLFSRANTREMVGATAVITQDYPEHILPDKLWKIRFLDKANVWYMKYVLSSESIRSIFSSVSTGTSGSMFNVSMDKFKSIRIPLPPLDRQQQFAAFVAQTDKSKFSVQQSLRELETLKKSLMQQYFG